MRLVSWNVNGLRAVWRKGFADWLSQTQPDIVCLQEIKAKPEQLTPQQRQPQGFRALWHPAERPGYSGVAIYTKREPVEVTIGIGMPEFDCEGRVLTARFPEFTLVNAYFPHSRRDLTRLDYKLRFCAAMSRWLAQRREAGERVVLCGDLNTSHHAIDLANPKANRKNAGFLPVERAWMDTILTAGFCDIFRERIAEGGHYTWWSNRKGVRERNVGWRIDYHLVDRRLMPHIRGVGHEPEIRGSDHCPVYLVLDC